METVPVCSLCKQAGTTICYCKKAPSVFCSSCYNQHKNQDSQSLHMANYIENPNLPKRAPEYDMCFCGSSTQGSCKFCRFSIGDKRRRLHDSHSVVQDQINEMSNKICDEMTRNLTKVEQFKKLLIETRQKVQSQLEYVLQKISVKIADLEQMIQDIAFEAESARTAEYLDESKYAQRLIKDYINSPRMNTSFQLELFDYQINLDIVLDSINNFCLFEKRSLPSPSLSYFKPKSNICVTCSLGRHETLKSEINCAENFKAGAAWCTIAEQKYFYCGGEGKGISNQVLLILANEGSAFAMPSMNASRSYHAILYYEKSVYVFGGISPVGRLKSVEKYDFERSQWLYLPSMLQPRSHFTATSCNKFIYVAGGCGSSTIEKFNPIEQLFTKVPVSLPFPSYWTLTASSGDSILIFQGNICMSIDTRTPSQYLKFNVENTGGWWSEMPAFAINNTLYFFKKNTIACLDIEGKVLTTIASVL